MGIAVYLQLLSIFSEGSLVETGSANRKNPLVSAIVSTFNSERFIRGKLEDLLAQTIAQRLEIIVVNSGSLQDEDSVVKHYLKTYPSIKYIRTEHRETIYKAWNRGIAISSGKYLTNTNTDDRLRPDALEEMSDFLEHHSQYAVVYGDQYITNVENQPFSQCRSRPVFGRLPFSRIRFLSGFCLGSQPMWRASLHHEANLWFDESLEVAGDYDFFCQVAERFNFFFLNEVLGSYYLSENKSNKEHLNSALTDSESYLVQDKYARRYIAALRPEERKRLQRNLLFRCAVPKIFYSVVHRLLGGAKSKILPKLFWCWFASVVFEASGNRHLAIALCKPYLKNPFAALIRRQYDRLLTGTAQ